MQIETIAYEIDGYAFQGKLVFPCAHGDRLPGLVLAPNWMGVNEDAVRRAILFARQGYAVFVADMYGASHRPQDHEEAAPLAGAVRADPSQARVRMGKALEALEDEGARRNILLPRLRAAVGFCFGGGNVLELARAGAPIQAAVSIHGDLKAMWPAEQGDIKAAILALHGAADPVIPRDHREAFEAEMSAAGASWQLVLFGGALHGYTDPGANVPPIARYDAYATERTYELAHRFISDAFAGNL